MREGDEEACLSSAVADALGDHAIGISRDTRPAPTPLLALQPRTLLVFRALQVGDMLCAVPALRALRHALPDARVTLVGLPWAQDFARRFAPYVDHFVAFPGYPGLPEQTPDVQAFERLADVLAAQRYDLALQMHGSGELTNTLVTRFGARAVAGFRPRAAPWPGERFLDYPASGPEVHRLLALTRFLGAPARGDELEFPLLEADRNELESFPPVQGLHAGGYICLHPGARSADKRWPLECFARVGQRLHVLTGLPIVVTGSQAEHLLGQALVEALGVPAVNAAGPISIGALAVLLAGARMLVSNDTGVSHVACGLDLPSVIIFSASDMERWAPLDAERHPYLWDPAGARVEEVIAHACRLLAARGR